MRQTRAAIAQWIHLHLLYLGPGFESQDDVRFEFYQWQVLFTFKCIKKTDINEKEAGNGQIKKLCDQGIGCSFRLHLSLGSNPRVECCFNHGPTPVSVLFHFHCFTIQSQIIERLQNVKA